MRIKRVISILMQTNKYLDLVNIYKIQSSIILEIKNQLQKKDEIKGVPIQEFVILQRIYHP